MVGGGGGHVKLYPCKMGGEGERKSRSHAEGGGVEFWGGFNTDA